MSISARLQVTPAADRRGWTRRSLSLVSSLHAPIGDVTIHDVSTTGLLIETRVELSVLDDLEIELPEVGHVSAVVMWTSGNFYGCQFKQGISQAAISAALLRSSPRLDVLETQHEPDPTEHYDDEGLQGNSKASLTVRLRAILGSAIVSWALIAWAIWSLSN